MNIADAAAINPNDIKTLLANIFGTFLIKGNPVFSNGPKCLPRNPHDCFILCNRDFDNFILVDKLLAKALRSFETCILVNNDLCGKYVIIYVISCNFSNVYICFYIINNCLIQKVFSINHNIIVF